MHDPPADRHGYKTTQYRTGVCVYILVYNSEVVRNVLKLIKAAIKSPRPSKRFYLLL